MDKTTKKTDLDEDIEASNKADGDIERMLWIARRRALITELRVLNAALGLPEVVIPAGVKVGN